MHGIILQDKMKWSYQSMVEQSKLTLRHKGAYHDFLSMILIYKYVHIAFYHYTPLHLCTCFSKQYFLCSNLTTKDFNFFQYSIRDPISFTNFTINHHTMFSSSTETEKQKNCNINGSNPFDTSLKSSIWCISQMCVVVPIQPSSKSYWTNKITPIWTYRLSITKLQPNQEWFYSVGYTETIAVSITAEFVYRRGPVSFTVSIIKDTNMLCIMLQRYKRYCYAMNYTTLL